MYHAYWGLVESPFRGQHDPRYFHQGGTHSEALARLHFLVEGRRTFGLLLGDSGSGKSLLLDVFARELGHVNRETARESLVGIGVHQLLWSLASQLGAEVSSNIDEFRLRRAFTDHLIANRLQHFTTILLLDDADEARPALIDEVLRLVALDTSPESRLTIVATAQPGRLNRLGNRLLELAELRIDLEGWELEETAAYVKSALAVAGRTSPIFSEPAVHRLHELSGGIPRRVKQLADLALLAGAGQNLALIEADTIDGVFEELGVVSVPAQLVSASVR